MVIEVTHLNETIEFLNNLDKEYQKEIIRETTQDLYENVKELAKNHIDTGTLEKNIRHEYSDDEGEVRICNDGMMVDWNGKKLNYALFVIFGSKPHTITPKKKKALRWEGLNDFVFAKKVSHPGYKGDDFLYKALLKTLDNLRSKGVKG